MRGIGAGGKGVYSFLVGLVFLRCAFFFLNDGRKRSQDSSLSAGSFSSSRLVEGRGGVVGCAAW